jgi:hypothetical protein
MPGTRTAPTIGGTPTNLLVSLHWVDDNNKTYANSILVDAASTDVQIEAIAAAAQAGSNASLWKVSIDNVYTGVPLASNADSAVHESIADKIRLQTKQLSSGAYNPAYIPAPLAVMVGDNNEVDITNGLFTTWRDAIQAVLPTGFALLNVGFVQNVQRNDSSNPI